MCSDLVKIDASRSCLGFIDEYSVFVINQSGILMDVCLPSADTLLFVINMYSRWRYHYYQEQS